MSKQLAKAYQGRDRNSLTPITGTNPPEMDLGDHSIPRNLKYSSRAKDNDIEQIRRRLRENRIAHHKFDAFLENKEGLQYYHGVYEPNNPEHIDGTEENMGTSKNLYDYILS